MGVPETEEGAGAGRNVNLARLEEAFVENFASRGELGASVSVWQAGAEVLSLASGFRDREKRQPWTAKTPVLVWSATKGVAAGCTLHAVSSAGLDLDVPVARIWPEFGAAGKAEITLGEVLSHRAGLAAFARPVPVTDHDAVIRAIEEQAPLWPRGSGHGYHPRTFGFLVDEIIRRICGMSLGQYWRRHFGDPLGIEFWIGVPGDLHDQVAAVFSPRSVSPADEFLKAFADQTSLTSRAFASPRGMNTPSAVNTAEARSGSFPGFGGIGTAHALGKWYAMLANGGQAGGVRYFTPEALGWMSTTLTNGYDKVLHIETAFSAGFMQDPIGPDGRKLRSIYGPSLRAFGHPGAGGSVAFADPENNVAFAYVMNQMEPGVLPSGKARALIAQLW